MTNDKTDILGQFGFELDAALFYDAIVKSTDDYVYIVNMKTDTSLISENMVRDFELPGRIVPGLVPLWGSLIHERDRARYDESIEQMLSGLTMYTMWSIRSETERMSTSGSYAAASSKGTSRAVPPCLRAL